MRCQFTTILLQFKPNVQSYGHRKFIFSIIVFLGFVRGKLIRTLIPTINPKSLLPTNLLREATFKNSCHPQERIEGQRILEGCLCPNNQWEMKIYDTHIWTFLCKMNMWHPPKFVLKTPRIVLKYVKQEKLEN
jgi:hypothetical protein